MYFTSHDFKELFTDFPELLCFLHKKVDATQDYNLEQMAPWMESMYKAAKEVLPQAFNTIPSSSPLYPLLKDLNFDKRSIELERTCLCLMTMEAVNAKNYNFFSKTPVLDGNPITQDQFNQLANRVQNYFPNSSVKLLRLELLLGDFGKIRPLRQALCKQFGITAQDPDHFMASLFNQSFQQLKVIFPCLTSMSEQEFSELRKINTGLHYGHFAHAESTARELEKLRQVLMERGMDYLYKNILVQAFDVAGAAAQAKGKILLNESIYNTYFKDMLPVLEKLPKMGSQNAYATYLIKRLEVCEQLADKINPSQLSSQDYLLGRLLCMFRIYQKPAADALKMALQNLTNETAFSESIAILKQYESNYQFSTPTYMPAFLNALKAHPDLSTLAKNNEDKQQVALRVGIRIIANCLQAHQTLVNKNQLTTINPINLNQLAGLVKTDFTAVVKLYDEPDIAIGKSDGVVYPSAWLKENKPASLLEYAHTSSQYVEFANNLAEEQNQKQKSLQFTV